jgi:hypothetical protein
MDVVNASKFMWFGDVRAPKHINSKGLEGHLLHKRSGSVDVLTKKTFFKPARTPGTTQNRPETAAPGPPDIVEWSQEITGFGGRGGGKAGRPQSVQVEALRYKMPPTGPER